MGRIQRLSEELANQIAAGEVVERPSSIVKELVENALDAEATRVVVDVEHGGTALIRVSDDGVGMAPDDAYVCVERHATSKIAKLEDLAAIGTFGFRGEALPSIASVSRFTLRTRARDASEGVEIVIEGGRPKASKPSGGAVGTTVEVRDLFFNVPARRKFLKATATESAHIGDVMLGMALARPDVTFVLSRDGRIVREFLRMPSRAERAAAALSGEKLVACKGSRWAIEVEAMLAPPERARAGATGLTLLVNGRTVRDRALARAVAQAYGSVLDGGRYPVGVVWVDLPADVVDVNVHPQKAEIRFADAREVFDAVTRELHSGLSQAFGLPALGKNLFVSAMRAAPTLRAVETSNFGAPREEGTLRSPEGLGDANLFAKDSPLGLDRPVDASTDGMGGLFGERGLYASLRFAGQVRTTFLVCEGHDGLYVVDQHAAAERVTFDRLRRAHAEQNVKMQKLLVPEIVELSAAEVALVASSEEEIRALGVEARSVGDTSVAVHGVPALLAHADPARILRDLVSELDRSSGRSFRGALDLVLATMACHGSVRAGDTLSREEAEALLVALDQADFKGHCPHGRPVVMRLPWAELERRVGR